MLEADDSGGKIHPDSTNLVMNTTLSKGSICGAYL